MPNIIYCFSGTGNCLAVARMAAKKLTNTEIVPMLTLRKNPEIPAKYERVGFIFPTCFGHPPKVVTQIGESLRVHSKQKIFIIVTCGGGNILTLSDFRKQMQLKTPNLIQGFAVRLPGNHIVGFGAWRASVQQRLFENSKKSVEQIVHQIQNGIPVKTRKDPNIKFMTFLSETFNGWLGVKDIHSTKAEYLTTNACVHCGICEELCPVGNIKVSDGKVTFGDNCQQCMACIQWCPQRAISHPNVPKERKRYHHPDITLDDMLALSNAKSSI